MDDHGVRARLNPLGRPRKYTVEQVQRVRRIFHEERPTNRVIAARTDVDVVTVSRILRGASYADVPWPDGLAPAQPRKASRLSVGTVQRIRRLVCSGVTYRETSEQTGVPKTTISHIMRGIRYSALPWPEGCSPRGVPTPVAPATTASAEAPHAEPAQRNPLSMAMARGREASLRVLDHTTRDIAAYSAQLDGLTGDDKAATEDSIRHAEKRRRAAELKLFAYASYRARRRQGMSAEEQQEELSYEIACIARMHARRDIALFTAQLDSLTGDDRKTAEDNIQYSTERMHATHRKVIAYEAKYATP